MNSNKKKALDQATIEAVFAYLINKADNETSKAGETDNDILNNMFSYAGSRIAVLACDIKSGKAFE